MIYGSHDSCCQIVVEHFFFLVDCLLVPNFSISGSVEGIALISGTICVANYVVVCVANNVVVCVIILFLCLCWGLLYFAAFLGIILALETSHALAYLEKLCHILPN